MFSTTTRAALAATAAAATIALLAGCGNDSSAGHTSSGASHSAGPSAPASGDFNPQDADFASSMIGHHRQAVQMASMAPAQKSGPEVTALGAKIAAAQQPEIDTMSGWLKAWGKEVPMEGMGHSAGMPGMMTAAQMDELKGATGAQFDKLFLQMMIEHHQGAITMAKAEQAGGKNADAKALAAKVITDQTAEIAQMQKMLQGK